MRIQIVDYIPKVLKSLDRWAVRRSHSKIPCVPDLSGRYSKANDIETVSSYIKASSLIGFEGYTGLSFLVTKQDNLCFVDLDGVIDDRGVVCPMASNIITRFADKAFIEKSMSGKGIHLICRCTTSIESMKTKTVEIYSDRKFVAITKKAIYCNEPVEDCSEDMQVLYQWVLDKKEKKQRQKISGGGSYYIRPQERLTPSEILDKAINSQNGKKLADLLSGDWASLGFPSQSEADLSLASILCWWFSDRSVAESIFVGSGLFRDDRRMKRVFDICYKGRTNGYRS